MEGSSETADLRAPALAIARELVDGAQPRDCGCGWEAEVALGVDEEEPVVGRGDVGPTLYDGTAGIALALAASAAVAEPEEADSIAETARGAARYALAAAPELLGSGRIGFFDGATGIAYAAVTTGRMTGDPGLLEQGMSLAREVAAALDAPDPGGSLDLMGGSAGAMLGLQSTSRVVGEPLSLGAVAERLAEAAVPQTWGAAWPGPDGDPPLLGLAHGAAGIALALGEAAAGENSGSRQDSAAARACAEGLEYERGWFDAERVAWPDLREHGPAPAEPSAWTVAWCHGAIGIGFARLRLARLLDDPVLLVEAGAALQAARLLVIGIGTRLREEGEASDCSPCHGLAGVAELLLVAAAALGVPDHTRAARRVAALMLEQRQVAGAWPCGLAGAGEVPALMTGTAGIALTLLRAAGAVSVPTPLLPGSAGW